jgi:hypothetical protein
MARIRRRFSLLELIWADGGYNAWQVEAAVTKVSLLNMKIVKRSGDRKGFVVVNVASRKVRLGATPRHRIRSKWLGFRLCFSNPIRAG